VEVLMPSKILGLSWGAVVVALLLLAGGVVLIGLARISAPLSARPDTNLVPDQGKGSKLVLGSGMTVEGTPNVVFYLSRNCVRSLEAKLSSDSYECGAVKNILVVDGATASGRWLFEGVDQTLEIFDSRWRDGGQAGSTGRVESGLWFGVREGDGDNTNIRADARKKLTLAVYAYAERKIHTIAADVDAVRGVHQIDDHRMVVIYERGGKTVAGTVSTTDFSTIASNELPRLAAGGAR
jgi:hypothetical protein